MSTLHVYISSKCCSFEGMTQDTKFDGEERYFDSPVVTLNFSLFAFHADFCLFAGILDSSVMDKSLIPVKI